MPIVSLDQKNATVEFGAFTDNRSLIFKFFDQLPAAQRDEALLKALNIGVIALLENRIATFLARTENELGTELEALKLLYERNVTAKEKSIQIGAEAETRVYESLRQMAADKGYDTDDIQPTGASAGALKRNKTGDVLIRVEGDDNKRIAIEVKFDGSMSLGEFGGADSASRPKDTAISQLIEANANRQATLSIIVFDKNRCGDALIKQVNGIQWIPNIGFVVIIDYDRGDFVHLHVSVDLARSMLKSQVQMESPSVLQALLERLVVDLATIKETEKLVQANHENLKKIAASVRKHALLVEFTQESIKHFIANGRVSQEELLALYRGDALKDKLKVANLEVEAIFHTS